MIKKDIKNKYEKGQTLLFVVVAVTIALSIGVAVSTRTINSLRRVSRTDTSTRVIAAAEGGIENLLGRTYSELDDAIDSFDCESIGATPELIESTSYCVYNFTPTEDDVITSRAVVSVERYNSNEDEDGYSIDLAPGEIIEIAFQVGSDTYSESTIEICWQEPASGDANDYAAIYYYSYNSDGDVRKGGLQPPGFAYGGNLSGRFEETNSSKLSYNFCRIVDLVDNAYGLRIKTLYNRAKMAVFPTGGAALPTQGYLLTSRGEIITGEESEERATVIVHKSFPYASDIFDYGIYTPGTLQ